MKRTNEILTAAEQDIEARFGRPIPELLRELYLDERLSQDKVGERLDVHRSTVYHWLKRYGIPTRHIGRGVRSKPAA